jgi:uncharacterized protein (TIGR02996 family)
MTDEDALLAAICAQPDDDQARLVYADWLEENGKPERGEFIRAQIERARLATVQDPRWTKLKKREQALLAADGESWSAALPGLKNVECEFVCGFVDSVKMPAAQFVELPSQLWQRTPVRRAVLTEANEVLAQLSASPHLARLASKARTARRRLASAARR